MMKNADHTFKAASSIVSTNAATVWSQLETLLRNLKTGETMELDLRAARMIDSVGLNTIVKVLRVTEDRSSQLRIRVGSESLLRLMRFTRLDQKAEVIAQ